MRKFFVAALVLLLMAPSARVHGQAYNARPKLVVILVIDQYRGERNNEADEGTNIYE